MPGRTSEMLTRPPERKRYNKPMQEKPGKSLSIIENSGWDQRLHLFRAGTEVDTAALVTQRYVVLIDTMATPELAAEIVGTMRPWLEGRQLLVVNTHADYDHCWGNAIFASPGGAYPAPILAHAQARARLRSAEAQASLAERQQQDTRFAQVRLVEPTITFTERLRIEGGDLTLELLPTPGHTEDHISIWIPELRLLLAGDAAEHPFPSVGQAETLPALRASLERLAGLHPAQVIPCHGGTTDTALLTRNLTYFAEVERQAALALGADRVPADWRERADMPELIGMPYEEALRLVGADEAPTSEFYRDAHLAAVRATLAHLLAAGQR
jgi:glyoxylase-like metal-dependent hydrolase (beta-lactamase superfamily II)